LETKEKKKFSEKKQPIFKTKKRTPQHLNQLPPS